MNAPIATAVLSEVEHYLAQALDLLDRHELGTVAAPHIDFGLSYVRDALTELNAHSPERFAG